MAFDIIIEGSFIVVNDTVTTEYISYPRSDTRFTVASSVYRFYINSPVSDGSGEPFILGGENNSFAYADLGTVTENGVVVAIGSEAVLTTFLRNKISLEITDSSTAVQSVTGLNTDNTDPINPIVKISVDGVTVTGLGTPASPLISGGSTVFTPTINGVTMKEVSQESDFGVASLGIITLEPNTIYFIRGIVLCTNRLSIVNEGIALKGWNRDDDGLKYTGANGAGDFITVTDVNCDISNLKFSSTNSTASDVILRGSNFSYGAYNDGRLKVLTITNCQFRDCYDVLHIEGFDLADFSQTLIWYVKATGIGCNFKNVSKLQISSCEFVRWFDEATIPTPSGYATASLVELLANGAGNGFGAINFSGNIFHPTQTQFGIRISDLATIGFGTISSNTGIDVGLTTGAVTEIDYDIQNSIVIQGNQKIANGNSYATMALGANLVLLNNSVTNPLVLKAANTVGGGGFTNPITFPISQRTTNIVADGSITYNSKINANFIVIVTATVSQSGNGVITMRLRNNGTAITTTVGTTEIRSGIADTLTFSVIGQAVLGDVFDVEVESSGGTDVLVSEFVLNGYQF
tara:strand:+ start:3412 stop:5142 length:1731 start_codon:yes stop_codon:yes gene_type:complete